MGMAGIAGAAGASARWSVCCVSLNLLCCGLNTPAPVWTPSSPLQAPPPPRRSPASLRRPPPAAAPPAQKSRGAPPPGRAQARLQGGQSRARKAGQGIMHSWGQRAPTTYPSMPAPDCRLLLESGPYHQAATAGWQGSPAISPANTATTFLRTTAWQKGDLQPADQAELCSGNTPAETAAF